MSDNRTVERLGEIEARLREVEGLVKALSFGAGEPFAGAEAEAHQHIAAIKAIVKRLVAALDTPVQAAAGEAEQDPATKEIMDRS